MHVQVLEQKLLDQQAAAALQLQELTSGHEQQTMVVNVTLAAAHQEQLMELQQAAVTEQQQLQQKLQQLEGMLSQRQQQEQGAVAEAGRQQQVQQLQEGVVLQLQQELHREKAVAAEARCAAEAAIAAKAAAEVQAEQHAAALALLEQKTTQQEKQGSKALRAALGQVLVLSEGWEKGLVEGVDRAVAAQEQRLQGLRERLTQAVLQQQQVVAVALAMKDATAEARRELAAATGRYEAVQRQLLQREQYWEEKLKQQQVEAEQEMRGQMQRVSGQVQEGARAVVLVHQLEKQLERAKGRQGAEAAGRIGELEGQVGRLQGALAAAWQQLAMQSYNGVACSERGRGGRVGVGGLLSAAALGLEAAGGSSSIEEGSERGMVGRSRGEGSRVMDRHSRGRNGMPSGPLNRHAALKEHHDEEGQARQQQRDGQDGGLVFGKQGEEAAAAVSDARSSGSPKKDQQVAEGAHGLCNGLSQHGRMRSQARDETRRRQELADAREIGELPSRERRVQVVEPVVLGEKSCSNATAAALLNRLSDLESVAYQLLESGSATG